MRPQQPSSWLTHIGRAALLILAVAVVGRLAYELLAPLLPLAMALVIVSGVWAVIMRRR